MWSIKGEDIWGIDFSPDDETIAFASGNVIKLFSIDGQLLKILKGHTKWIDAVAFSPDGKIIASGSFDHTMKLWSVKGKLLKTRKTKSYIQSLSFRPDGKVILSTASDGAKLWNLKGRLLKELNPRGGNGKKRYFQS